MSNEEHPLYATWENMRQRCNNPNATRYHRYGGRGIKVCREWDDFWQFVADVGDKPGPEYSLDRINSDGDYEPGNVRWATKWEQQWNSSNSKQVVIEGREYPSINEAARAYGITQATVNKRINRLGWSVEDAILTPLAQGKNQIPLSRRKFSVEIEKAFFEMAKEEYEP